MAIKITRIFLNKNMTVKNQTNKLTITLKG